MPITIAGKTFPTLTHAVKHLRATRPDIKNPIKYIGETEALIQKRRAAKAESENPTKKPR